MAPEEGLEPSTSRLTAARSTIELLWNTEEPLPSCLKLARCKDGKSTNPDAARQSDFADFVVPISKNNPRRAFLVFRVAQLPRSRPTPSRFKQGSLAATFAAELKK